MDLSLLGTLISHHVEEQTTLAYMTPLVLLLILITVGITFSIVMSTVYKISTIIIEAYATR